MSDNIDYNELAKAVNEAMTARSAAPKTTRRRSATPAKSRGQLMDFVPRKKKATPKKRPVTPPKPAPAPTPAPANNSQTVTVRTNVKRPTPKNVTTSNIARRSTPKPLSRIPTIRKVTAKPAAKRPVTPPRPTTGRSSVAAAIQQKQRQVAASTAPAEPTPAPAPTPAETAPKTVPATKPKEEPKLEEPKLEAPNANNYSLGGRSPFLADAKVEKRPLGSDIPETSTSSLRSTKNVYSQKNPSKVPATRRKKHTVAESPKSHSGWLWTLIVLVVIAAGAGVGYLAYVLVFANQL